jgi:beta-xylosidase
MYTADPSARVFNDTLYVYPSHDREKAVWWDMTDWYAFSTTNLKDFKTHGPILSIKDIVWAKKWAWAPDCVKRNGKYYFYFPTDGSKIGVAVSDKPSGPFTDAIGKPLITNKSEGVVSNRDFIDPCVFVDEDEKAYLFAGQIDLNAVELNPDMISYQSKVKIIIGVDHFFEAIWVHKHNQKYYLSYSGKDDKGFCKIMYAMSDSILGPYTYKGVILDEMNSGTNHHSIIEYKGKNYLFYHNSDLALKKIPAKSAERAYTQWRRSVCIDYLFYNTDGTIKKVIPTNKGVEKIKLK